MAQKAKLDRYAQLLAALYGHGPTTRAALSDLLDWSQASVNRLVGELRDLRLIVEAGDAQVNARGRPSDILGLNPEHGAALGLEFGAGVLRWALLDAVGGLVDHGEAEAVPFRPELATLDALVRSVRKALGSRGHAWEGVMALTVAFHDVVTADGHWVTWERGSLAPGSFTPLEPLPVRRALQEKLKKLVLVEDYSRALAEAEHRFGESRGVVDAIYLFVSHYGVGSGIFANNHLLKPSSGVCGEVGHVVVDEGGAPCVCGNRGCLCTVATGAAVVRRLGGRSASVPGDITFEHVCARAQQGDARAQEVLLETAHYVARALGNTINITGTPNVVIGGPLKHAGQTFLDDLTGALRTRVMPVLAGDLSVSYASLPPYGGAFGAALQALDAYWQDAGFLDRTKASLTATPTPTV